MEERLPFHLGQVVTDVLGRKAVVVGCCGDLVAYRRTEDTPRYNDGHPQVEESFRDTMRHVDGQELGEYEPVSHELWWRTYPDESEWARDEGSFQEEHRDRMNEEIRKITHP